MAPDFSWMVGRSLKVTIYEYHSFLSLGEPLGISVYCPWRLLVNKRIKVSREDHQQRFGHPKPIDAAESASALLSGFLITSVRFQEGTSDLFFEFDGGQQLEIIPISCGYESWLIYAPSQKEIIAQGGGQIVERSL